MRLAILFVLCLPALAAASSCSFSAGGHSYNFAPLTKSAGQADYTATDDAGYGYHFNLCAPSTISEQNCNQASGLLCQYMNSQFVAVVAKSDSSGVWSLIDSSDPSKGVQMVYKNGDPCFPSMNPRQSTFQFTCSANQKAGTATIAEKNCNYVVTMPTCYACPGGCGGSSGGSGSSHKGLSGGWIFIIILLVLLPVYIVAGCIYNHRKDRERPLKEKCPNSAFWFSLPGLIKDGCLFTVSGIRKCIGRLTGKQDGYQQTA